MSVINYSFYRKSTKREFLGALSVNILNLLHFLTLKKIKKVIDFSNTVYTNNIIFFSPYVNITTCVTLYYGLHVPCTSSMIYQDIKLVFNKYNSIYKFLIWNSKFENLKLCEVIGSFHSKALTVLTFETRISIKNSISILLQVQKRKIIKRKTMKTFKTNTC